MSARKLQLNLLLLLITLISLQSCTTNSKKTVSAKNGVIDLTNIDFEKHDNISLEGEWEFYWNKLLSHEDFSKNKTLPDTIVNCLSEWNGYVIDGKELQGLGFATYRLNLRLNPEVHNLAIRTHYQFSAFNLFLNGELLVSNGKVSDDPEKMEAQYLPKVAFFQTDKIENEIILQISNNHHYKGGFRFPISIGTQKSIMTERDYYFSLDAFLAGAFLIMFLYSFGLYFFRKKDLASLYFAILTLIFFFRTIATGEYIFVYYFPEIPWSIHNLIEYLTLFLIPIPFFLFFLKLYPESTNKKISFFYIFVCVIYAIITIFSNSIFSSSLILSFNIILFTGAIYGIITLTKAVQKKKQGASILIFGFGFVTLTILIDILHYFAIIEIGGLLPLGFFVFIVTQAFALSLHVFQTEKDNINLEHTIKTVHLLNEINKQIISVLNVENVIEAVYGNINRTMDAAVFNIGIFNKKDQLLEFKDGICNGKPLPYSSIKLSEQNYFSVQCFITNKPILLSNIKKSNKNLFWSETNSMSAPKSAIFVPLEVKGEVIGIITVKSFVKNGFTNYHLDVLKNIASYVAIAIDNAVVYGRVDDQRLEIKEVNTELQNMNQELITMNDELNITNEKLNQLYSFKEDMTNMIVHDLKTPLGAVINAKLIDNDQKRWDLVQQSGFVMLNLVENILNVYKYENTSIELQKSEVILINVINDAKEEVSFLIKNKSLKIELDKSLNCTIQVDEEIIRRVFVNLLSNAVKFSPEGGVISIKGLASDGKIKISVTNQGVGIPKEKQNLIFERFGQAKKKTSDKIGSTGLGLTFCKMAVEAHSGKIGVVSETETGVEFWFTLPNTLYN